MRKRKNIPEVFTTVSIVAVVSLTSALVIILFGFVADYFAGLYSRHVCVAFVLPAAGCAVFALYRIFHIPYGTGTRKVVSDTADGEKVAPSLAPSIFIGTCCTLAFGGSIGKEAAAMQIGAAAGNFACNHVDLHIDRRRDFAVCGMASALTVLFGAPIGSALFAIEATDYKTGSSISSVLLIFSSALISKAVCLIFGIEGISATFSFPAIDFFSIVFLITVSLSVAVLGAIYCYGLKIGRAAVDTIAIHPCIKLVIGGAILAFFLIFGGASFFSGTGSIQLAAALSGEDTGLFFIGKIVLTVAFLSVGFKGGEIMPAMCIGATFGAFAAVFSGSVDISFAAAIGMVAMISAAVNCPLAAFAIACEAFPICGAGWFAASAVVAFSATAYVSLYDNTTVWNKVKATMIRTRNKKNASGVSEEE